MTTWEPTKTPTKRQEATWELEWAPGDYIEVEFRAMPLWMFSQKMTAGFESLKEVGEVALNGLV